MSDVKRTPLINAIIDSKAGERKPGDYPDFLSSPCVYTCLWYLYLCWEKYMNTPWQSTQELMRSVGFIYGNIFRQ